MFWLAWMIGPRPSDDVDALCSIAAAMLSASSL